jgi:hypothetical protein
LIPIGFFEFGGNFGTNIIFPGKAYKAARVGNARTAMPGNYSVGNLHGQNALQVGGSFVLIEIMLVVMANQRFEFGRRVLVELV